MFKKIFLLQFILISGSFAMESEYDDLFKTQQSPESLQSAAASATVKKLVAQKTLKEFAENPHAEKFSKLEDLSDHPVFSQITEEFQNFFPILKWRATLLNSVNFKFDESCKGMICERGMFIVRFEDEIRILDINDGETKQIINTKSNSLYLHNDELFIDVDSSSMLVWDLKAKKISYTINIDHSDSKYVSDMIVFIKHGYELIFWDIHEHKISNEIKLFENCSCLFFNKDNKKHLIRIFIDRINVGNSLQDYHVVQIWDLENKKIVKSYDLAPGTYNLNYMLIKDKIIAYNLLYSKCFVLDLASGKISTQDYFSKFELPFLDNSNGLAVFICKDETLYLCFKNKKCLVTDNKNQQILENDPFLKKIRLDNPDCSLMGFKIRNSNVIIFNLKKNYFENLNFNQLYLLVYMHINQLKPNYGLNSELWKIYDSLDYKFKQIYPIDTKTFMTSNFSKQSACSIV